MSNRVVLGVAGGIAAYKAADLLRQLTEAGHDVTVVPDRGGAASSSARRPGPRCRTTRSRPTSGPVPRTSRTSASAGRPTSSSSPRRPPTCSPGPRTAWPTTCSPTPCSPPAARCCSRRRCTPRCGSTRRRPTTSPPCAAAARSCSSPATGRLTGTDTGKGRLPEPAEIAGSGRAAAAPARPRCRTTSPAGTSWSAPAAPASRSTRCASSATPPPAGRGSAVAAVAAARGARVTLVAANVELPDAGGHRRGAGGDRARAARGRAQGGRGRRRGGDGRRGRRLPAGPAAHRRRSRRPGAAPEPVDARREPGRARRAGGRRAGRGAVLVGFAAETGDDAGRVLEHGRAKLARKGCDLLVVNAVRPGQAFGQPDNAGVILGRDGSEQVDAARAQGGAGRGPVGRGRSPGWPVLCAVASSAAGRRSGPDRLDADPDLDRTAAHAARSICEPSPLHVRVRHRGAPGQDRRPDQRLDPRRAARRGPGQPRGGRDPDHHRPGARRRRGHHRGLRRHPDDRARSGSSRSATTRPARASTARPAGSASRSGAVAGHRAGRRHRLRGAGRGLRGRRRQRRAPATRA